MLTLTSVLVFEADIVQMMHQIIAALAKSDVTVPDSHDIHIDITRAGSQVQGPNFGMVYKLCSYTPTAEHSAWPRIAMFV